MVVGVGWAPKLGVYQLKSKGFNLNTGRGQGHYSARARDAATITNGSESWQVQPPWPEFLSSGPPAPAPDSRHSRFLVALAMKKENTPYLYL